MNVGGTNYDVTTFQGSYDTDTAKFATPANGGVMPWWGDFNLARAFATAIADQLGRPNLISGPLPFGPLFAYSKFFNNGAD